MIRWSAMILAMVACTPEEARRAPRVAHEALLDLPVWPEEDATFVHPVLEVPEGFGTPGVFVVGGHGAPKNPGNLGCLCQLEETFTLDASLDLATRLDTMGIFEVTTGRSSEEERPSYPSRLRSLRRSGAEAMIELHSDSRGGDYYAADIADDGTWCFESEDAPGLAVLVSDDGPAWLADARLALARHVADALWETGFLLYQGGYGTKYAADDTSGVFVDRRGLMMLRRPSVPSILIETHNAKDRAEVERWNEPRTRDAFGRAVALGLLRYFGERS